MNIIGHKDILNFFEKALAADRLHHAYLFVGPEGLGKQTMARHFAAQLFDIDAAVLETQPDFSFLEQGINEKTGKTKKNIAIEQIHKLRHFFQGRPLLKTRKIAIINDADRMSIGAMNALLKTLEEPRGDAMVFLIAKDEYGILPTIQSRCQRLYVHPVLQSDIAAYLESTDLDESIRHEMVTASVGFPGRVISWIEDMEVYNDYKKEIIRCESLMGVPLYKKLALVDDLFGKKDDHIATRNALQDTLQLWQLVFRDIHAAALHIDTPSTVPLSSKQNHTSYDILAVQDAMTHAIELLGKNVHPKLLVEHVLLTLP